MTDDAYTRSARATEDRAAQGLAVLRALATALDVGGKEERLAVISEALVDVPAVKAVRYALALRRAEAQAILVRIDTRGITSAWRQLMAEYQREDVEHGSDRTIHLAGIKLPPGTVCPRGHTIDEGGVYRIRDGSETPITTCPLVVTAMGRDAVTGTVRMRIAWRSRDRWRELEVDRADIADARRLIRHAAQPGFPVHSGNSADVVGYLSAFEAANERVLPEERTTSRLGWHGDEWVGPDGGETIRLVPESPSDALRIDALRPHGTWEGWCRIVRDVLRGYPAAMLGVYAGAASPLLAILGVDGFVVDWSYTTSRGKTTSLRAAVSVWGWPHESGLLLSWASASAVGPVNAASLLHSIPVCLDDTKRGKDSVIGAALYDIPAGQERMRGNADGTARRTRTWRTLLLSTGEASITSFSDGGGAAARTLSIRTPPMGEASAANKSAADAIKAGFLEHYGHLGPRVVAYAQTHRARLRERYAVARQTYGGIASTAAGQRVSDYVAVLAVAAEVCTAVGVPDDDGGAMAVAASAIRVAERGADRPGDALEEIVTWARMNRASFRDRAGDTERSPPRGWIGIWADDVVGFQRKELEDRLRESGFDAKSIIETWAATGVLDCNANQITKKIRYPGGVMTCIAIRMKHFT